MFHRDEKRKFEILKILKTKNFLKNFKFFFLLLIVEEFSIKMDGEWKNFAEHLLPENYAKQGQQQLCARDKRIEELLYHVIFTFWQGSVDR